MLGQFALLFDTRLMFLRCSKALKNYNAAYADYNSLKSRTREESKVIREALEVAVKEVDDIKEEEPLIYKVFFK